MKKVTAILSALIISAFLTMCKPSDYYTVTPDGWHMHSNVPVDTLKK